MTIAGIGMFYSVYAIALSGKDAVFGGMIVVGVAFVLWGLIASRFMIGPTRTAAAAE